MTSVPSKHPSKLPLLKRLDWFNTFFLISLPLLAAGFIYAHLRWEEFTWELIPLFFIFYFVTGISITGGYHRLFSHQAYQARGWVKFLYLFFAAGTFENSALKWCSDHRRHHRHVDTDDDPYNINEGFFYAHMGWIFFKESPELKDKYFPDLEKDPWVMWQHRHYLPLALLSGVILPVLAGAYYGAPIGGLAIPGLLRMVMVHHSTYFINSLAHMWGSQNYCDKNTAKDNFFLALMTHGEGYHNYHHRFQWDYRNGIRWYHWDPTKWTIQLLSWLGGATRLRRVSESEILKARLLMEEKKVQRKALRLPSFEMHSLESLKKKVLEAQLKLIEIRKEYAEMKKNLPQQGREKLDQLKLRLKMAKHEFKSVRREWQFYLQGLSLQLGAVS